MLLSKVFYYILLIFKEVTYIIRPRIARTCMVAAQTMCFSHWQVLDFLAEILY